MLHRTPLRAFALLPMLVGATSAMAAVPTISKVTLTKTGTTFSATITGKSLGAAPAGIPCTNCAIPEFFLVDAPKLASSVAYNITGWSNTSITLTGIAVPAGDAIFLGATNDAAKNLATWSGNVPGKVKPQNPKIKSVAFSGSGQTLQITVTGSGFGSAPSGVPGSGDIPFLEYLEWSVKDKQQFNYPWAAGWNGQGFTDTVTFNYTSWSDTKIVINGFGGAYGTQGFVATKGDPFVLLVWQPPGVIPGSTGPQTGKAGRVK